MFFGMKKQAEAVKENSELIQANASELFRLSSYIDGDDELRAELRDLSERVKRLKPVEGKPEADDKISYKIDELRKEISRADGESDKARRILSELSELLTASGD